MNLRIAIVVALLALAAALPNAAYACTEFPPELDEVTHDAEVIVLGRIIEVRPTGFTIATVRALKGTVPDRFDLQDPIVTSICGDTLDTRSVGQPLILAIVPGRDRTMYRYWTLFEGRLVGSTEIPPGVWTLGQLAGRIAASLGLEPLPFEEPEQPVPEPTEEPGTQGPRQPDDELPLRSSQPLVRPTGAPSEVPAQPQQDMVPLSLWLVTALLGTLAFIGLVVAAFALRRQRP